MSDPTDVELAHYVVRHFGGQGIQAGSFYTALIGAIAAADPANQRRLEPAFPTLVDMVRVGQNDPAGMARLEAVKAGDTWVPPRGRA